MLVGAAALVVAAALASCSSGSSTSKVGEGTDDPGLTLGGQVGGSGSSGGFAIGGSASGSGLSVETFGSGATGASGLPGVTVHGVAEGTVPADLAFAVVVPAVRGADPLAGGLSPQDHKGVVDALTAQGFGPDDVSFPLDGRYGQPRIEVKVALDQLATRGPAVVDAVERVLGRSQSSGAAFALSSCDPASGPLRQQALDQAERQARALADAGKLALGSVAALVQDGLPEALVPVTGTATGRCPLAVGGDLQGFDARPTVRLSVGVTVTYSLAGAPAAPASRPLVSASGSGTAPGKADEAYVLVLYESSDQGQPAPSGADQRRVVDALAKLKVDRKDVVVTSTSDYRAVVRVATKADGLATNGKNILRAVEDVLGRSDESGARFSSSTCPALLTKARKEAVADARQRAAGLADAAGIKLGDVQAVSEVDPAGVDPCDDSIDALLALDSYDSTPLQSFDAPANVNVRTTVELAQLIAG